MASRALTVRLRIASSSWLGSISAAGRSGSHAQLHFDRRPDRARNEIAHSGQQVADIDRLGPQRLAASEAEQSLEQGLGTIGRLEGIGEQPRRARIAIRRICAAAGRAHR